MRRRDDVLSQNKRFYTYCGRQCLESAGFSWSRCFAFTTNPLLYSPDSFFDKDLHKRINSFKRRWLLQCFIFVPGPMLFVWDRLALISWARSGPLMIWEKNKETNKKIEVLNSKQKFRELLYLHMLRSRTVSIQRASPSDEGCSMNRDWIWSFLKCSFGTSILPDLSDWVSR